MPTTLLLAPPPLRLSDLPRAPCSDTRDHALFLICQLFEGQDVQHVQQSASPCPIILDQGEKNP